MEVLRLRVQDIDLPRRQVRVRDGKGHKDRAAMLLVWLVEPLTNHLEKGRSHPVQDPD